MKVPATILTKILLILFFTTFPVFAETSLPDFIKQVELRRGTWTGLKADITIQFTSSNGKQASCSGTLVYHRLDEKILLQCYGAKEKLVFILKTTDREFELYLPGHRTLYKGNIFTLEDSPAIESHLRAWDLYRAFKPMVIANDLASMETLEGGQSKITVMRSAGVVSRELTLTPEGDIISEIYYSFTGEPSVEIQRSEFSEIGASTVGVATVYPRKIKILAHKQNSTMETLFEFKKADFLADVSENDFALPLPDHARVMVLEDL